MESNFIDLVNEEYTAEATQHPKVQVVADWIADSFSSIERSLILGSTAVTSRVVRDVTLIVKSVPTQWEQSKAKAESRMNARLRARGLIK